MILDFQGLDQLAKGLKTAPKPSPRLTPFVRVKSARQKAAAVSISHDPSTRIPRSIPIASGLGEAIVKRDKPGGELCLESLANIDVGDPDVPVRILFNFLESGDVVRRDDEHDAFGNHYHAVAPSVTQAVAIPK